MLAWPSAAAGTHYRCFLWGCQTVAGCARRRTDQDVRGEVVLPCLWSQKVGTAGEPVKIWRWKESLIESASRASTQAANLCGAFSFRSKGPAPIPSMQTQWNICSRIYDISPEGFPSGHIKTNSSMLLATPVTTGALTILCPHVSWFERKITKNCFLLLGKMRGSDQRFWVISDLSYF